MPKFEICSSLLKSTSVLLASSCLLYSNAFGGGSVGVSGFVLPDGTVMQAQEIETFDFINALSNINSGYTYDIDQNEIQVRLDRVTLRYGIPLVEGVNEYNENVTMIESSIIKNNFDLDNSNNQNWYVSKPNSALNANGNGWINRLEVSEDVFSELSYISNLNQLQNISNPYQNNTIKVQNCYSKMFGDQFISTTYKDNNTIIFPSRDRGTINQQLNESVYVNGNINVEIPLNLRKILNSFDSQLPSQENHLFDLDCQ